MFAAVRSKARWTRGFTLIELLVVIAIIAILAAILFPVFTQARDKAKLSRCLVHLSQIGKAIHAYTDDHDGRYPIGPTYHYNSSGNITSCDTWWTSQMIGGISPGYMADPNNWGNPELWYHSAPKDRPLYKYTSKNLEMWKCPSEQRQHNADKPTATPFDATNDFPSRYWGTSYIMNGVYAWDGSWPTNRSAPTPFYTLMGPKVVKGAYPPPKTTSDVKHQTKIWLVGERTLHYYWNLKFKGTDEKKAPLGHMGDKPYSPVVFCDGHTATIMLDQDVLADPNGRWGFIEKGWHPDPRWKNEGL